uniref:Monodehydroascorbate reductase n=1 Tax=Tanacetum cinerariifolium TaxID=118510 RepID=A0A699HJS7_TANCI|nr:hypothetical protein [Tanacetum cinerariifolium]
MNITIDQQVALDEALVPHASRLRIGKSNFRLRSDLKSKESTLQVVYDVLKLTPFYKIRFKMNNKKHTVNLEYFREMIQICLRIPNKPFDELPFEEEILAFLRELGHGGEIKMITDVNINKLHQPWRSFAAVINKCLSGKSTGYDSLCLSQAQILWGMYHKKNVDFIYLLWEDFRYQVEHKDAKKSNEMYYPRFTKVIINFFMTKDQSIPRRNKLNWHFSRDDHMFTTIKLVSRHQNTQQYGAILPVKLTNEAIRNSKSYKEYYAIASGAEPPKIKASIKKKQSILTLHESGVDEGTGIIPGVPDVPTYEFDDEEISWKSSEDDDDDEVKISEHDDDVDDQSDDDDDDDEQTDSDNDDNDEDSHGMNVEGDKIDDKGANEEDKANELYRDMNINLESRDTQMADVQITQVIEDTHVTLTLVNPEDVPVTTTAEPPLLSATTFPPPSIPIISHMKQTPAPSPANVPSSSLQDLPNFGSLFGLDHRLKALETNLSEFMQTNQFAEAISSIPGIVDKYLDHRMNEAMKVAVQLHSDRLQDEAQTENEDFLNKLDVNIQKIIKEQVMVQVSKTLPKIEKTVNEQLEAEVLTHSTNSYKISHAVAADLSELKLKKILIDKMESNKDTVTLKRRQDDDDKDEEPSAGSNQWSKRRRARKEPDSTSAPKEKTSKTSGKSTKGSKSHHKIASESAPAEEPMHTTQD